MRSLYRASAPKLLSFSPSSASLCQPQGNEKMPQNYTHNRVRRLARGRFYTGALSVATHRGLMRHHQDHYDTPGISHQQSVFCVCVCVCVCIGGTRVRFNICWDRFHLLHSPLPVLHHALPTSRSIGSGTQTHTCDDASPPHRQLSRACPTSLGMILGGKPS